MSVLATLLLGVAIADLAGGQLRRTGIRAAWLPTVVGVLTLGLLGALAGLLDGPGVALVLLAAVTIAAWQYTAARSFATDRFHWLPLAVLGGGAALLLTLAGYAAPVGGPLAHWLGWVGLPGLSAAGPDRVLLVTGLLAVQVSTANVVVRLVLRHVGAMRPSGPQPSDRLRGGRLLGPMERLVIVGLGLAGQVTAASLVIAAKGLIRWPELQQSRAATDHPGFPERTTDITIDEVTEYFLVGSFVSWVIALGAVAIAYLN